MPVNILMPALSPTMEKGNLARWLKKEGEAVKAGDVIAEIETDKATMEVEAVDEGTLGKILVPEGTADVAVNTPIAVILGEGEDASAIKSGGGAAEPAQQRKAAESAPPAGGETVEAPAREPSAVAAPPQIGDNAGLVTGRGGTPWLRNPSLPSRWKPASRASTSFRPISARTSKPTTFHPARWKKSPRARSIR